MSVRKNMHRKSLRDKVGPYTTSLMMLAVVLIFGAVSIIGTSYMRVARKADVVSCTTLFGFGAVTVVTEKFSLHGKDYDQTNETLHPSKTPICMIPATTYAGPLSKGTFVDAAGLSYSAVPADDVGRVLSPGSAYIEASLTAASAGH